MSSAHGDYFKGIIDGNTDGPSPYSNVGNKAIIMNDIREIFKSLKEGKDPSAMINQLMYKMQNFGSNVVGQDSEAQTQLTKYVSGVAKIQGYINVKDGAKVQNIDKFTGKELIGDGNLVSPEQALTNEVDYLANDPMTKYKVMANPNGGSTPVYTSHPPTLNPAYKFFSKHGDLYTSMKSNLNNLLTSLQNPDGGTPSGFGGGSNGYTNPDGFLQHGVYADWKEKNGVPDGSIKHMWDMADQKIDPSSDPPKKPDPSVLNQVMSGIGSVNQSYTSASSAVQTVGKTDLQTFNAEQGNMNKFWQAMVTLNKTLVQGQKTS